MGHPPRLDIKPLAWDQLELLDGYFGAAVVVGFVGEEHYGDVVEG
jgi:hypothetical protein